MLKTLRRRLILSHILPTLLIIPLIGIALIYVVETRVILPNLANELAGDATLMISLLDDQGDIWHDSASARALLTRIDPGLTTRMMLLDANGYLLASSDATDATRLDQFIEHPDLEQALAGKISIGTTYSHRLGTEVADVLAPIMGPDQQVMGLIRLSYRLDGVYRQFMSLRRLIAGVLAAGLVLGAIVGWSLALNLSNPLQCMTDAVRQLASGQRLAILPEEGPEEVRLLSHAVNTLAEHRRSLEQTRRELLANLVHELGRPLGALQAALEALRHGALENRCLTKELLDGMFVEVQQLRRSLDDLVRFRDQVVGQIQLKCQVTALNEWLPQILSPWGEAVKAKGLHWEIEISSNLPTLEIDPDRLNQAVGNLLSNAIKYTPPGGTVSVKVGIVNDRIAIRVSDTGPGIAPEDQERIFTPFYRVQQPGKQPEGMGLGLSIARDLIVAHDGQLELVSTPGQGSHFLLWLPYK